MKCTVLFFILFFLFFSPHLALAIENPLSLPNNKMGIHILFPSELDTAANLINSSGGDWGYVTIPIQIEDKDLGKWQHFMDNCRKFHIIPIVRLATESDYFNTPVWRKPTQEDVVDFANFLNSLNWPVKNRYIIVFNEVNRGDEWGGNSNPQEYAQLLIFTVDTFKQRSEDFFVISAGLDNAAPNIAGKYINEYNFINQMEDAVPGIFSKIDGLGSHSYPNPGFSQPSRLVTDKSISSFIFEKNLAYNLSGKNLPVFITETGWTKKVLSESLIGSYFKYAFESVWSDENIVAVTPFLLQAGVEPFSQFSLLNENGGSGEVYQTLQKIVKIKGNPTINSTLPSSISHESSNMPLKTFPNIPQYEDLSIQMVNTVKPFLKWIFRIPD